MLEGPQDRRDRDDALAAFGLVAEGEPDEDDQALELWPETETPLLIFSALLTQWRMGPTGAVGLDYAVLPVVERRLGITRQQSREAFEGLRVMEREALAWIAEGKA